MKKVLAIVLCVIMVFACTACSMGQTDKQDKRLDDYVSKYYGEYDIVDKDRMYFNTSTLYTLKDKAAGFEYTAVVSEVYLSDLGLTKVEEANAKVLFVDSNFYESYLFNIATSVKEDAATTLLKKYEECQMNVLFVPYTDSLMDAFETDEVEVAVYLNKMNEDAIKEVVSLFRAQDTRNLLNHCTLTVYVSEKTEFTRDEADVYYYDFYLDTLYEAAADNSFVALHDILLYTNVENPEIISWKNDVLPSKLETWEGWSLIGDDEASASIEYSINGQRYTFHPALGYKEFKTELTDLNVYKGSFLDIIACEAIGCPELLLGMYGTMYPEVYFSMAAYNKPIVEENNSTTETPETNTPSEEVTE